MPEDFANSDRVHGGVSLPAPLPVKKPLRRGRILAFVGAIALVGVMILIALWAIPVFSTGASGVTALGPGESAAIVGTDLLVTVPDGWSGMAEYMPQWPSWIGGGPIAPASNGLRQAVSLESDEYAFRFLVFTSEDEWVAHQRIVTAASEAVDIEGETFSARDWAAREDPGGMTLHLLTADDSAGEHMYVMMAAKGHDATLTELEATVDELVSD